jgi:hypothetical protein
LKIGFVRCRRRRRPRRTFRRRGNQTAIDAHDVDEAIERRGETTETVRTAGLEGVIVDLAALEIQQGSMRAHDRSAVVASEDATSTGVNRSSRTRRR